MLAGLGLLVGCWAILPPYSGPFLATEDTVEFVDHVVPGIVILAISALTFLFARRRGGSSTLFPAGLGIFLSGFWMTATHAPLVLQATRQEAPWGATVYHSLPGLAVLTLGAVWAFTFRTLPEDDH
jgi:hypothetical protein